MPPMQLSRAPRYVNNSGVSTELGDKEDLSRKLMGDLAAPIAATTVREPIQIGPRFS
jgi:hypothetical protein